MLVPVHGGGFAGGARSNQRGHTVCNLILHQTIQRGEVNLTVLKGGDEGRADAGEQGLAHHDFLLNQVDQFFLSM